MVCTAKWKIDNEMQSENNVGENLREEGICQSDLDRTKNTSNRIGKGKT